MTQLCLNGIVRNESGRILRMLDSVKDYISTFVILDTGSTDNTVELIEQWGKDNGISGLVALGTFVNFSQARNQALDAGRSWHIHPDAPPFDYFLLCDADMELKVEIPELAFNGLTAEAYEMTQTAGTYSYRNLRLLNAKSTARYIGVTHEYLNAQTGMVVAGAHFVDHADGANRVEKYPRDIKLFEEDLKTDQNNGRTWFYLGNTYREMQDWPQAERCYRRKLELPTWPEEDWTAQINLANCLEAQGLEDAYLKETLRAYQMRPQRAEPLHALAKHYREKGEQNTAMVFTEKGISIPRPDDKLFIEDWVYDWGFRHEYSISGFYQEETRERAFRINNGLALDPKVPDYIRGSARSNMAFYLRPLKDFCPSYKDQEIRFSPSPGYTAMNPCVTQKPNGDLEVLLRTVNYRIDEHGRYMIGETGCWDAPIETENWLLQLDHEDLNITDSIPVRWYRPEAKFDKVIGLEDMRIFWHDNERKFVACCREQSETGMPEQWYGRVVDGSAGALAVDAKRISDPHKCEKNWSYVTGRDTFMYRVDTVQWGDRQEHHPCNMAVENISGGSPYIPFKNGYLSVVHEAITHPSHGKRVYQHRFAWIDRHLMNPKLSLPFVFHEVQIEFAAGLARSWDGTLVISFGERDESAWLASVSKYDVAAMLGL